MAFTYDLAQLDPSTGTVLSAVRFLLQDTVEAEAELQDEEITAVYGGTDATLEQYQRVWSAAALCAGALHRKWVRLADFSAGGTSVQTQKRAEAWRSIRDELTGTALFLAGSSDLAVVGSTRTATF